MSPEVNRFFGAEATSNNKRKPEGAPANNK
jgi:hypothetical protein